VPGFAGAPMHGGAPRKAPRTRSGTNDRSVRTGGRAPAQKSVAHRMRSIEKRPIAGVPGKL
jgi:hypothetical protein